MHIMYISVSTHIPFLALSSEKTLKQTDQLVMSIPSTRYGLKIEFLTKRTWGLLEKWEIPGVTQELYKTRPEHLIIPESKEATKD